jgi:3-deoxy-D-manno-octulosonate 8-phosphate phosphatase (KDO 8-P phosphatase)
MTTLEARARGIRLLCTDVDGVLTNGELHFTGEGGHTKSFHVRDGAGITFLQRCGIPVAFISGLDSPSTWARAKHLGIADCFAGNLAKGPILEQLCAKYGLELEQVAHIGDDLADLPLLDRVGLACCPRDAVAEVHSACHFVVPMDGGRGVLRAVSELILQAQGRWDEVVSRHRERA